MNIPFFLQLSGWRFDWISFLLGTAAGLLIAALFWRTRPWLQRRLRQFRHWLQEKRDWLRAGVEGRYLNELRLSLESAHLLQHHFPLHKAYIPFRLLAPYKAEATVDQQNGMQMHYLWPDLAGFVGLPPPPAMSETALLRNGRRVLIVGPPGTGKSMLLARLALRCVDARSGLTDEDLFLANRFPVHLYLAEMVWRGEAYEAALSNPLDLIIKALQPRLNSLTASGMGELIKIMGKRGDLQLFLDGWDCVPDELRAPVARWVDALLKEFPQTGLFMTTNQTGYGLLLEKGFTTTTILPWRMGQATQFAALFGRAFSFTQQPDPADFWQPGQSVLETMFRLWHVHQHGRAADIPRHLTALIPPALTAFSIDQEDWWSDNVGAFWRKAAYLMLTAEQVCLGQSALESLMHDFATVGTEVDKTLHRQLVESLDKSALFIRWSNGTIAFRSNLIRDYLAAEYLISHRDRQDLVNHIDDRSWEWVLKFYVARRGATELATPLLRAKDSTLSRKRVFQVASWMPAAADEGDWRRQTMILLGQMIRASSFTMLLRRRAVAALVMTGEAGVMRFVEQLLERSDPFLRHLGTMGLAYLMPDEAALQQLQQMLGDSDPQVRRAAVYGLAPHQYVAPAETPIVDALLSDDEALSRLMAQELALNGEQGIGLLKDAAQDEDLQVRRAAIYGLATLDVPWVEPFLVDIERHDPEWFVRTAANSALELLRARGKSAPWRPVQPEKQRWLADYALQNGRSVPSGAAALRYLVQILGEAEGSEVRAAAAALLGQLPAREAIPALETAVRESDPLVSEAAFSTLCRLQHAYEA